MDEQPSITALAWELLYGDKYEPIPDPNQPENEPYARIMRKQRAESIGHFATGGGKVLFDEWKKKVRAGTLALVTISEEKLCGCPACMVLREIKPRFKLILEAETILSEQRNNP